MSLRSVIASKWAKIVGVGLMSGGFVLRNIDFYPSVLKLIAPDYVHGKTAIQKLDSGGTLTNGMDGFDVLSKLVLEDMSKVNNKAVPDDIRVESISEAGSFIMMGEAKVSNLKITLTAKTTRLTKENKYIVHMSGISNALEDIKRKNVYVMSERMFFVGLIIDVISILAMPNKSPNSIHAATSIPAPQPPNQTPYPDGGGREKQK
jgi:hypothetical protein